jgi:hypothetical protein
MVVLRIIIRNNNLLYLQEINICRIRRTPRHYDSKKNYKHDHNTLCTAD